ncbi:hypothetical protein [Marinimicrococcus flavescens]|uniref:DUF4363 family protein n=1 Tax=Marinimicrococcus flavescens TaxID=3031815 RepID=A0AAP4D6T3_9PROT|nr:hypothetical protein [Marinimicrococcus flavescens]
MRDRVVMMVAGLALACALPAAGVAQTTGPAQAGPAVSAEAVASWKSRIDAMVAALEGDEPVPFERLEALYDEVRGSFEDNAATQRAEDRYYNALRSLDQAAEGLREESRASAIAALSQAAVLLEELHGQLEGEAAR